MTRKEAIAKGHKTYSTGKPCKHGHKAESYVANSTCVECAKENARRYKKRHPENAIAWRAANPDYFKEWHRKNPDYFKRWKQKQQRTTFIDKLVTWFQTR